MELLLLIASQTFFDSSVVPSVSGQESRKKSFPCSHKLGERTGQVSHDNSRRVRTHEKNLGETVRRLGTIIQNTFVPPFLPTRLSAPGSPRMTPSKFEKKAKHSVLRRNSKFHVGVLWLTSKKCTKKRDARAMLLFCQINKNNCSYEVIVAVVLGIVT